MYSCHGVSRTSLFLERFRSEFRIFFKSNKPVSKTYRPQNDNFCLLMTLRFLFDILYFECVYRRGGDSIFAGKIALIANSVQELYMNLIRI